MTPGEPLCKTCDNKDAAYVYHNNKYNYEVICVYDMANFPRMVKCEKYTPRSTADGQDTE